MTGNATILEVGWTCMAAIGWLAALWVVQDAYIDLREARRHGDEILSLIARVNLGVAVGVGVVLTVFGGIGIRAMTLPANTATGQPDLATQIVGWAFIASGAILALIPLAGAWTRRRVRTLADEESERGYWDGTERRKR